VTDGRQEDVKDRLERVRDRIARAAHNADRDPAEITLIAATKTVPVERLREAIRHGCRRFGENRVQEAIAKMDALTDVPELEWHFIGPLQTNKIKLVLGRFALIHAIDRLEIAERLNKALVDGKLVQPVLLEVNVSGEATKHGFSPDMLMNAVGRMAQFPALQIRGLMTIPAASVSPEEGRLKFRYLKKLALQVERESFPGVSMKELSMGMSADFECAIEEGATMVRIGTAVFGERKGAA
jgi:PLP dependent protein